MVQKYRIRDRDLVLDQVLVAAAPSLLLRDEKSGERVCAERVEQLRPGHPRSPRAGSSRPSRSPQGGEEGFLVDREGVPGLGDCGPMRGVLDGVREHQETRLRFRSLLVLRGGVEGSGDAGREPGRPHPEEEQPTRLPAGRTGPVDPAIGVGGVVHPDRGGGTRFEIVVIGWGELDRLRVEQPLHDLSAAAARRDHPIDRLVIEEPDPVRPVLVEELLVELLERGPAGDLNSGFSRPTCAVAPQRLQFTTGRARRSMCRSRSSAWNRSISERTPPASSRGRFVTIRDISRIQSWSRTLKRGRGFSADPERAQATSATTSSASARWSASCQSRMTRTCASPAAIASSEAGPLCSAMILRTRWHR